MELLISPKNRLYICDKHADIWCGSEAELPDFVSIYYLKLDNDQLKCNICDIILQVNEKSIELLEHVKSAHTQVYNLHKENPDEIVGFQIEFLNLNDFNDHLDPKNQDIIIEEVCEASKEEIVKPLNENVEPIDSLMLLTPAKKKGIRSERETRRRSWVWKYFESVSNILARCTLCGVVLSVKGGHTNMNRHFRSKHSSIYQQEVAQKVVNLDSIDDLEKTTTTMKLKTKRKSWVWKYFKRISKTISRCTLCGVVLSIKGAEVPDWVSIYYLKLENEQMKCNICEVILEVNEKSMELLEHVKSAHTQVYDLHKENPEATVGFQIEFLNLHDDKEDGDPKNQHIIIGEVCEATIEEIIKPLNENMEPIDPQMLSTPAKKKGIRRESETRKKSWVWKYFERMSNIIYRCTLCGAVLSIKGCNTNNMNRHVKSKHSNIYQQEIPEKRLAELDPIDDVENTMTTMKVELCDSDMELYDSKSPKQLPRRSWIWTYFNRISNTLAQCKLCQRNICHGGNATGNMNRHLKMIHHKTAPRDYAWIWKVFDRGDGIFSCKICQFRCVKFTDSEKNISCILQHLKTDHGVVSGEQIITSTDCEEED